MMITKQSETFKNDLGPIDPRVAVKFKRALFQL